MTVVADPYRKLNEDEYIPVSSFSDLTVGDQIVISQERNGKMFRYTEAELVSIHGEFGVANTQIKIMLPNRLEEIVVPWKYARDVVKIFRKELKLVNIIISGKDVYKLLRTLENNHRPDVVAIGKKIKAQLEGSELE